MREEPDVPTSFGVVPQRTASSSRAWLLLTGAVVSEVSGSLSLRGAIDHPWLYAVTALGYVTAFALLAFVLRAGMALSVAYGVWGACGVALTALLGALVFGEPITAVMALGMSLVIGGVLLVESGATHGESPDAPTASSATASLEAQR